MMALIRSSLDPTETINTGQSHTESTTLNLAMAKEILTRCQYQTPKPPDRPNAPYLRFSRKKWQSVRKEYPDAQMWEIGRKIGQLWREASDAEKAEYSQEYEREKIEYEKAMKAYHQSPAFQQYLAAKNRAKQAIEKGAMPISSGNGGRRPESGVVIQPVDEDEGVEYSSKRIAAARFERNHRLIAELFNPNVVADSRNVVMQHRMDTLKKQGNSLKLHQEKLEEELGRLENVFSNKKRQLEKNSEEFAVNLKKVCDDKPQLDAEKFNAMVEEWKGKLLDAYKEYQKNQEAIKQKQEAEKQQTPVLFSLIGGGGTDEGVPAPNAESTASTEVKAPEQPAEAAVPKPEQTEADVAPKAAEEPAKEEELTPEAPPVPAQPEEEAKPVEAEEPKEQSRRKPPTQNRPKPRKRTPRPKLRSRRKRRRRKKRRPKKPPSRAKIELRVYVFVL
ncbi:hypothetical protein L596_018529 [Steinernema carpocapsae]|uniref:HMG box domain-containing protein n=2 Tax=Steinernema carpocapsae TaxID=34508 RepID=A0A4U5N4Y1_STECR|nr:hypothetical protein L596_018529 [Steinernema carpocapsae]